jgi:hypothetical protein
MSNLNEHQWIEQAMLVIDALIKKDDRFYKLIENSHENLYAVYKKEHPKDRVILTIDLLDNSVFRSIYHYGYDAYMITCDVCGVPENERIAGPKYNNRNTTWVIGKNRCVWECLDRLTTVAGMLPSVRTDGLYETKTSKILYTFWSDNKAKCGACAFDIVNKHNVTTDYLFLRYKNPFTQELVYEIEPPMLKWTDQHVTPHHDYCTLWCLSNTYETFIPGEETKPWMHKIHIYVAIVMNGLNRLELCYAFKVNDRDVYFKTVSEITTLADINLYFATNEAVMNGVYYLVSEIISDLLESYFQNNADLLQPETNDLTKSSWKTIIHRPTLRVPQQ